MDLFAKEPDLSCKSYEEIKAMAESCDRCPLSQGRHKVVFGHGPVPCDLMLIGEAPGADDRAGQLLTQILASVDIKQPDDIYITNTVKCRPPNNRDPLTTEQEACRPYLKAQIRLVKPKIILLAGSPACKAILNSNEPMNSLRGQWKKLPDNPEISVFPIFHPAYLLHNPQKTKGSPKWQTWRDMQEVKNALAYFRKVEELSQ